MNLKGGGWAFCGYARKRVSAVFAPTAAAMPGCRHIWGFLSSPVSQLALPPTLAPPPPPPRYVKPSCGARGVVSSRWYSFTAGRAQKFNRWHEKKRGERKKHFCNPLSWRLDGRKLCLNLIFVGKRPRWLVAGFFGNLQKMGLSGLNFPEEGFTVCFSSSTLERPTQQLVWKCVTNINPVT